MAAVQTYYTTSDQERARQAAGRVARRIEDAIASYTTPGIEAAVLRLLGMPQAQRFVDWLHRCGVLGTGAAHWLAGAMIRLRAAAPASVTPALVQELEPADLAVPVAVAPEVLKHAVRGAGRTLEARRRARDERLALLAAGPGRRIIEAAVDAETVAYDAADLVILVSPAASPAEPALRRARQRANQASDRAGRYIRLALHAPAADVAYLSVLAALTGLDAVVLAELDTVDTHFARRICARAGMMALGTGRADDDVGRELAEALVAEQLATLAGLSSAGWGWMPGQPAHCPALMSLLAPALVVGAPFPAGGDSPAEPAGPGERAWRQALAYLEAWPALDLDPVALIKKAPGYWNPFA